jgi:hypothetical protein
VRGIGAVLDPPVADEDLGFEERVELFDGQQLVSDAAAVGLDPGGSPTASPVRCSRHRSRRRPRSHLAAIHPHDWSGSWNGKIDGTITRDGDGWLAYLRPEDPPAYPRSPRSAGSTPWRRRRWGPTRCGRPDDGPARSGADDETQPSRSRMTAPTLPSTAIYLKGKTPHGRLPARASSDGRSRLASPYPSTGRAAESQNGQSVGHIGGCFREDVGCDAPGHALRATDRELDCHHRFARLRGDQDFAVVAFHDDPA